MCGPVARQMLSIRILKVAHDSRVEANKLRTYIQLAHVYSPEHPFSTEEMAAEREDDWKKILRSGWSLSHFRKGNLAFIARTQYPEGFKDYLARQDEFLYGEKKPIILLERFEPEKARFFREELEMAANKTTGNLSGDLDGYLNSSFEGMLALRRISDKRDKEIARNLIQAEDLIRKRYPKLKEETIKLTLALGGLHYPETHMDIEADIKDLRSHAKKEYCDRTYEATKGEILNDETRALILISHLADRGRRYEEIINLPLERLVDMALCN
jgi:hypothetical protein